MVTRLRGSTCVFAALLAAACEPGGDDGGPAILDPASPDRLTRELSANATTVEGSIPDETMSDERPEYAFVGTSTSIVVEFGQPIEMPFTFTSTGSNTLQRRVEFVGADQHLLSTIPPAEADELVEAEEQLVLTIEARAVGVGPFDVLVAFSNSDGSSVVYGAPVELRVETTSPNGEIGVPSSYDSGFASCAVEDSPLTRFANDVTTGRCFFIVDGFREDCDRCDDVGVDTCARRLCTP